MASRVDVIVLDTGPLAEPVGEAQWRPRVYCEADLRKNDGDLISAKRVAITSSAVSYYEQNSTRSIEELDTLCQDLIYAPITTPIMRRAAQLWADARQQGRPTASDAALDADVILAATALELAAAGEEPLVITTNPAHLTRYTAAVTWQDSGLVWPYQ